MALCSAPAPVEPGLQPSAGSADAAVVPMVLWRAVGVQRSCGLGTGLMMCESSSALLGLYADNAEASSACVRLPPVPAMPGGRSGVSQTVAARNISSCPSQLLSHLPSSCLDFACV